VAKLCSDDGTVAGLAPANATTPIPTANIISALTNTSTPYYANLNAALTDASGRLESACVRGNIYAPSDLANVLSGNSLGYLYRIVTELTVCYLYDRRPNALADMEPPAFYGRAEVELAELANGQRIFALDVTADAGSTSGVAIDPVASQFNPVTNVLICRRLFGRRGAQTCQND
jgi:hypothetical protein